MPLHKEFVSMVMGMALMSAAQASLAAEDAKHPCALIRDSADRLACYDQAFGKPADVKAAAAAPVTPEQRFGLPEKEVPKKENKSAESAAPASVTAAVTSLTRQRDGKFVVTLDNAQVWSQSELNSQADVAVGDTVTVRRGVLNSYLLVTKAGIGTRVKRLK